MRKILLLTSCLSVLPSCMDNRDTGTDQEEIQIVTALPERVSGTYTRDGITLEFDTVQTDTYKSVVVRSSSGEELIRMEHRGDLIVSSAYGGRAKVTTDMAVLRLSAEMGKLAEEDRPDFSLVGGIVEEGDLRAFTQLEESPEYAILPWLSRELGKNGYTGKAYPATLGFHMIATQAAQVRGIVVPPLDLVDDGSVAYCQDLRGDPNGDDSLGMCGPGGSCWSWTCGDCCCHDGCKSHDNSCRNCKWYKPWNCLLCATFASFAAGGCGTSCQGADYGEPACTGFGGWCSDNSQCCEHYPDANEAAAGNVQAYCSSAGQCAYSGSCQGACGGYAQTCWCDAACTTYGDCCWDACSSCGNC